MQEAEAEPAPELQFELELELEQEREEPDIVEIVKPTRRLTGGILPNQPAPKARPKVVINQDADISIISGPPFDNIVLGETGDDTRKEGLADSDGEAASVEWYELLSDISI